VRSSLIAKNIEQLSMIAWTVTALKMRVRPARQPQKSHYFALAESDL
jgi:hypothetical protein